MIMKAIYKILTATLALAARVGCYEEFDMPEPHPEYATDEDFEAAFADEGLERITIREVKNKFTEAFGGLSGNGSNDNWSNTKTIKFGKLTSLEAFAQEETTSHFYEWEEAENKYIRGKVLTDDTQGNVYKSLYIIDETAAIEIKLTNGTYLDYPQGSTVYVKLKNLYLGNYRMMLSIGEGPTTSYNKYYNNVEVVQTDNGFYEIPKVMTGELKYYANSNIEDPVEIRSHIFRGAKGELAKPSRDTDSAIAEVLLVNKDNYKELGEKDFGRLVCFEGVRCYYAGVPNQNGVTNPALKNGTYEQLFPSWVDTATRNPVVSKAWYKWAFSNNGTSLYGSVCFTYLTDAELEAAGYSQSAKGVYSVRSSGYSRFAGRNVVKDGAVGTITAIYGIYSKQSNYSGNASNDYAAYQLSVNKFEDLKFPSDAYLTDEQVVAMTPNGYTEGNDRYDSQNDSYYVPSAVGGEDDERTDSRD